MGTTRQLSAPGRLLDVEAGGLHDGSNPNNEDLMTANSHGDPIASTLLRRLAEAVDCQAYGSVTWVVADRTFPHTVDTVFGSEADARDRAGEKGGTFDWFGPYVNIEPPVERSGLMAFGGFCYHRTMTSEIECPEIVGSVAISVQYTEKRTKKIVTLPQEDLDALVLTDRAYGKFFLPYIFEMYGIDEAYRRRHGGM